MRAIKLKECFSRKSKKAIPKPSYSIAKISLEEEGTLKSHEKRKRRNLEGSHQKAAFKWLSLQYPQARKVTFHPANGGYRHQESYIDKNGKTRYYSKEAKSLKSQGVTAGISDLICLYPSKDYHGFICEFKFGDNGLSESQSQFLENVGNKGYYTCVCYSYFEFIEHFNFYMGKSHIMPQMRSIK